MNICAISFLSGDIFLIQIDTFDQAEEYLKRARPVLPAIYNENLARYDWHARDPDEATCNQTVHVKLEFQVGRLQNRIAHLENQMTIANLDPDELSDLQEIVLDDDDDEEIQLVMPVPVKIKTEANENDASEFNGTIDWDGSFDNGSDNDNMDSQPTDGEVATANDEPVTAENNNNPAGGSGNVVQAISPVVNQQQNSCTSICDPVAGFINTITDVSCKFMCELKKCIY